MTISTEILRDLLSDTSINKAVYYSPEYSTFIQTTENANMGDGDFIKTPTVEEHHALTQKLFRKRLRKNSIPAGDMLSIGYHMSTGDLQDFLTKNNMDFLYKEVDFRAVYVLFNTWTKENNIDIEWSEVQIEQDC